jgi:hypothetical protein
MSTIELLLKQTLKISHENQERMHFPFCGIQTKRRFYKSPAHCLASIALSCICVVFYSRCHKPVEHQKVIHATVRGPITFKISVYHLVEKDPESSLLLYRYLKFFMYKKCVCCKLLFHLRPSFLPYSFIVRFRCPRWGRLTINAICQY